MAAGKGRGQSEVDNVFDQKWRLAHLVIDVI